MQIGAPDWGFASGKFAKPLSAATTGGQWLWRHSNHHNSHNLASSRHDQVADCGGFRALALRIGCIFDITTRMNAALLIE